MSTTKSSISGADRSALKYNLMGHPLIVVVDDGSGGRRAGAHLNTIGDLDRHWPKDGNPAAYIKSGKSWKSVVYTPKSDAKRLIPFRVSIGGFAYAHIMPAGPRGIMIRENHFWELGDLGNRLADATEAKAKTIELTADEIDRLDKFENEVLNRPRPTLDEACNCTGYIDWFNARLKKKCDAIRMKQDLERPANYDGCDGEHNQHLPVI